MTLAQQLIYLVRVCTLGIVIATFIMQLEPERSFRSATLRFDGFGHATYASIRLRVGKENYPILFVDEDVYRFLVNHEHGGTVDVLLRPGNGIVEMKQGGTLIFSADQYMRARDRSKSAARKWLYLSLMVLIGSFMVRPRLL